MHHTATTRLGDAWSGLLSTGPEYDGHLSNHAPMVAEALARHGHDLTPWLRTYGPRLKPALARGRVIAPADRGAAVGDPSRLPDWIATFGTEVDEQGSREVLRTWWPRLLPGLAAAATHPVIRLGHVVRTLRETDGGAEAVEG